MAATHVPETRTTFTDILKNDFAPAIIQTTAEKSFLLSHLERVAGKVDFGGKGFIIPLEFDNMGSTGARGEDDDLPNSLPGSWTRSTVPIYSNYFSTAVTGLAIETSDQSKYAWAEAWQRDIVVKTRAFRQQLNRQLNGDGDAILAQVDGTPSLSSSDYTITLDNAYGVSGQNNSDVNGGKFTTTNMQVDFYTGSSKRDAGAVKITGITKGAFPSTSATIVCASGDCDEVADGDYMYVAGAYGNEMPGMQVLIDDGTAAATFQSVTIATYPEFASEVGYGSTSGTAEALTTNRMTNLVDDIGVNGGMVDWILTSNAVYLTYGEMARAEGLITNERKIVGPLDTGWTAVEFMGIPIYKDPYCIDNMFFVDSRCIKLHQAGEQGWLTQGGSDIIKQDGDKDRWKAYWKWHVTPAMHNRSWCGKLVDISVTSNKL